MKSIKQNKQTKKPKQIIVIRRADRNQNQLALVQPKKQKTKRVKNTMRGYNDNPRQQQVPFTSRTNGRRGMQKVQSKIVSFREELGSINGSSAFSTIAYTINPGQAGSFPWLALEAAQWEKYRFRKLQYEYTPQVTEFSTNGVGSVVIGFDSDASDSPPNDLKHALNCEPREYDLPCKHINLNIPVGYLNTLTDGFFVRTGNLPGQSDIKTYDCGVMNLSTVGNINSNPIGILAVEYTVEFLIPILEPTLGAPANNSVTSLQDTLAALTSAESYQPLLAAASSSTVVNVNGLNGVNTAGSIVLPAGNYIWNAVTKFVCSGAFLTETYVIFLKNANQQGPTSITLSAAILATDTTQNCGGYISCNGTDAIALSIFATFASGTCTATTVLTLVAI
jgi:hypothetical protein